MIGTFDLSPAPARPADRLHLGLRHDVAEQWGRRLRELSSIDLARETLADPLGEALLAFAPEILPRLLGGAEADGVVRACIVRYACSNDARFGRAHPCDVSVSVDLTTGAWDTSQGDTGADLVSLIRWYWHGSTTATSRFARDLPTESLLVALLGLAVLDLSRQRGVS